MYENENEMEKKNFEKEIFWLEIPFLVVVDV